MSLYIITLLFLLQKKVANYIHRKVNSGEGKRVHWVIWELVAYVIFAILSMGMIYTEQRIFNYIDLSNPTTTNGDLAILGMLLLAIVQFVVFLCEGIVRITFSIILYCQNKDIPEDDIKLTITLGVLATIFLISVLIFG